MSNIEVAKLTRISIQNWAKQNDIELSVETDNNPKVGLVTVVLMGDIKILYYYKHKVILVADSQQMLSLNPLKPGTKISDKLIEVTQEHLK